MAINVKTKSRAKIELLCKRGLNLIFQVKHAEDNGASAIMIYNDPQNYGPVPAKDTFPNSMWMPRDGVQRGSIGRGDGDILTPGWPSTGMAVLFWFLLSV